MVNVKEDLFHAIAKNLLLFRKNIKKENETNNKRVLDVVRMDDVCCPDCHLCHDPFWSVLTMTLIQPTIETWKETHNIVRSRGQTFARMMYLVGVDTLGNLQFLRLEKIK